MFARKISYNLFAVFINQFLGIILGIIVPRLFIIKLGSEANGLINSVSHILVYLGLLDAGIGMASLQALYRPVAENDKMRICEILSATKHQYRKIGMLYFAGLFVISAVMPFTISSNFSFIQIALVVLFSGLPSVIRFFLQGKFIILLTAEGKGYILSFFESIIHLAVTIAKIILLFYGFGLVAIQFSFFCIGLLQVCFIYIYMKKQYKWVNFKCTPDFKAISQSKNVLIHQISLLVFSNTDIIIITYFCGLKVVSVYVIYTMLLGIPMRFSSFFGSIIFSLAHTWNTDKERYIKLHDMMEMLYNTLTFSLLCIANIFILPFIKLYTAGVNDINYLDCYLPYFCIGCSILANIRYICGQLISIDGHFKNTQKQTMLESGINIVVSLICVKFFGIYGVFIGTIAALLYRSNDIIIYANIKIIKRSPLKAYKCIITNMIVFIIITVVTHNIFKTVALNTYFQIIATAALCAMIIIPVFFACMFLIEKESVMLIYQFIKAYIQKIRAKFSCFCISH